jgi:hypothetical protein
VATYFDDPLQVLDYIHDYVSDKAEQIGLSFVGYGEERLIPEYPAILISAGPVTRVVHGTHTFEITFIFEMWVYHAKLSDSHRVRTKDDLKLVKGIRDTMHGNLRLYKDIDQPIPTDPQIVFGHISAEDPAFINRGKGEGVVGSRIEWTGISQSRFK